MVANDALAELLQSAELMEPAELTSAEESPVQLTLGFRGLGFLGFLGFRGLG